MSVLGNVLDALRNAVETSGGPSGPGAEFVTADGRLHAVLPIVDTAADGSPVVRLGSGATAPAVTVRFTDDQGDVIAEFRARENDRSTCED
ncbi:hypothetical protein SMCF_1924 [Streptomyces coelicoflavus ZG0656]|nr:hypothetical protein SMCF_1924 [Streptomyces coelicoflavus ZG0656]MZE44948.1 hypothetical protein [Streptomyces sp. SID5477]